MPDLFTISLLIIVVCNLGVLLLYIRFSRGFSAIRCIHDALHALCGEGEWSLEDVADVVLKEHKQTRDQSSQVQDNLSSIVHQDGSLTRERIAQVKTRLADEERQDQREKAKARRLSKANGKLAGGRKA